MFKKFKKHPVISIVLVLLLFGFVVGATTWDMTFTTFSNLWIGSQSDTPTQTLGSNSVYIKGDVEIDGTLYADGGSEVGSVTRSFSLPLGGAAVDGGNDIDDASTPDLTSGDNIPTIVWADSSETTSIQWTFRIPSDFSSGLVVYALVSSNEASGSGTKLDWAVTVNTDGGGFASPTSQDLVECTSAGLDVSNEVLTLVSDATAEALYSAGKWVTLELFNASTNDDDLELKGVDVTYTATH
jgi:hypothetical protein